MTNQTKNYSYQAFFLILKILLIVFLLFITLIVFGTFQHFSALEKIIKSGNFSPTNDNQIDQKSPTKNNNSSSLINGDGSNYYLGNKEAQITIVEFSDFACPHCKNSFTKIRQLSLEHQDEIKIIFRDLPIITTYSLDLALAARCAGEQNLFWTMHDKLFMNQGVKENTAILKLAKQSGVEINQFKSCFETKKYLTQIQKDFSDARELGIHDQGTPIWFINGHKLIGDIPEKTFAKIINKLLN